MDSPLYKRVTALDVHQAKITACAMIEDDERDRRALARWAQL